MRGLELARAYYEAFGKELLQQFPAVLPYIAVGLAGSGSECYGYDDEISRDHDFEPGFCIFLPGEEVVDRRTAFLLERAYAKLPKEFMGLKRSPVDPVGGSRHGVLRMADFFSSKTGSSDGELSTEQWFAVPEYGLLEATNGAVFTDPYGELTRIREKLSAYPEAVRRKKLAGYLLLMGQAGQYNYGRCIARGETAAAQLAVFEFTQSAIHAIFLLNRTYLPYYKWQFYALRRLPLLSDLAEPLESLISTDNREPEKKTEAIENICAAIAEALRLQGLTNLQNPEMEPQAYAVNNTIPDPNIRNLHILQGV